MERRRSRRIPVNLEANIISAGKSYVGLIENVSEGGLEYLMTSQVLVSEKFTPKKSLEVTFVIPSGETLHLNCELVWFLRAPLSEKLLTLGLKIIDPSTKYKEFIKSLDTDTPI
jgi:hypothetical protein